MEMRFEQLLPAPLEMVFRFHANPAHLGLLHADSSGFRLIEHCGNVCPGSTTWFEQTIAGCIPLVLGFRHTLYEPPHRFRDELIHGPFSQFTHVHEFEQTDAGMIVRDILNVQLAWPYGGALGTRLLVAPAFHSVFAFRKLTLSRLAESGELERLADTKQLGGIS